MENSLYILLTSDARIICATLKDYLCNLGHQVEIVRDGHTALKKVNAQHYDLVLVDLRVPGINDTEFLAKVQHNRQETPVVLISGDDTVRKIIEAFRLDAGSVLPQSIQFPSVNAGHENGRRLGKLHRNRCNLHETPKGVQARKNPQLKNQCFVGNSSATQQVRERIRQAVEANVDTILLTGETGTGKEVVAREIHLQSSLEECPFIAVNCSALPESLVESELFGHVKGAFTNATRDRPGYFEMANSGTLFLDEIADLPLHTQAKLLRILDTRTLIPVGGSQEISVQERVISALNKDPTHIVESGQFRSDLYYRLNVFSIHLQPLRERPEDILPLADHFLGAYTARNGRIFEGFSEAAQSSLLDYQYPGNVRELRNIVECSATLCPPEVSLIGAEHINIQKGVSAKLLSQSDQLAGKNEYEWILQVLEENRWNRRQTAKKLGIPYSTLRFKMEKLGIS